MTDANIKRTECSKISGETSTKDTKAHPPDGEHDELWVVRWRRDTGGKRRFVRYEHFVGYTDVCAMRE